MSGAPGQGWAWRSISTGVVSWENLFPETSLKLKVILLIFFPYWWVKCRLVVDVTVMGLFEVCIKPLWSGIQNCRLLSGLSPSKLNSSE